MNNLNKKIKETQEPDFVNSEIFKARPKKINSIRIANAFRTAGFDKQSANVYYCSKSLVIAGGKLKHISSCRTRMCPLCDWRKSVKSRVVAYKVLNELCDYENSDLQKLSNVNFIFLTLTIANCSCDELPETLDKLLTTWRKFIRTDFYKSNILGSFRALEITYKKDADEYHPHIHAVCHCVNEYYKKKYITHKKLKEYWKAALDVDYEPYVFIQPFRAADVTQLNKSICEVTKYATKTSDVLKYGVGESKQADILKTLYLATFGRRLIAYQGDLKRIKHELNIDDNIKNADDIEDLENDLEYIYSFNFKLRKYELMED